MYLVSLSLLAHRHWRTDMSMWCIELEIWLVEQRLPPNATATNWTGGNALHYFNDLANTVRKQHPIPRDFEGAWRQEEVIISNH